MDFSQKNEGGARCAALVRSPKGGTGAKGKMDVDAPIRSASSSGKPVRFSHKSTLVSKRLTQSGTFLSTLTHLYNFQTYLATHLV